MPSPPHCGHLNEEGDRFVVVSRSDDGLSHCQKPLDSETRRSACVG